LYTLLRENEAQIKKTKYTLMHFMAPQVSPLKLSLILQKQKSGLNAIYALFAGKPSFILSAKRK